MFKETPSLEEFHNWEREPVTKWFLNWFKELREETIAEVENGNLRGDRDSGVSSEFKAGEITGSLEVIGYVVRLRPKNELR